MMGYLIEQTLASDKALSAALLAEMLGADALLLLTDVPPVWTRWPKSDGEPIRHANPAKLRTMTFDHGSIEPKVQAACRFAERTGRQAGIGSIEEADSILA